MLKINSMSIPPFLRIGFIALFVFGHTACSLHRSKPDSAPSSQIPQSKLPTDAVPRIEPLSKYGNPVSYEVFGKRYYTMKSSQDFVQRGIASWYGKKFHGRRTSSGEKYNMYAMTAAHKELPLPTYVQVTNLKNGKKIVVRVNDRGPFHDNRVIDLSYSAATKLDIVSQGTGLVEVRALDPRNYHADNNMNAETSLLDLQDSTAVVQQEPMQELSSLDETEAVVREEVKTAYVAAKVNSKSQQDVSGSSVYDPKVFVQVGAFSVRNNANQLVSQLNDLGLGKISISSITQNDQQLHRVRIGPLLTVQAADETVFKLKNMGLKEHRVVIE